MPKKMPKNKQQGSLRKQAAAWRAQAATAEDALAQWALLFLAEHAEALALESPYALLPLAAIKGNGGDMA
jgi:hypothetical protein